MKERKTLSVKDILNGKYVEEKEEDINFKTIDLNNEKDVYAWANYWREQKRKR